MDEKGFKKFLRDNYENENTRKTYFIWARQFDNWLFLTTKISMPQKKASSEIMRCTFRMNISNQEVFFMV